MPLPMMGPPGMSGLPGMPPATPSPGGGNPLLALLASMQGGGLPPPPASPPQNGGMDKLMPFMAGAGFQGILGQITKFLKIISTVGTREDKSTRVPMQGNIGQMDRTAMQMAQMRQGMPGPGVMPQQGPANLPMPMLGGRPPGM